MVHALRRMVTQGHPVHRDICGKEVSESLVTYGLSIALRLRKMYVVFKAM